MTDEEAKEQFERQARERIEALQKIFTLLQKRLTPGDEPAVVFLPE